MQGSGQNVFPHLTTFPYNHSREWKLARCYLVENSSRDWRINRAGADV